MKQQYKAQTKQQRSLRVKTNIKAGQMDLVPDPNIPTDTYGRRAR